MLGIYSAVGCQNRRVSILRRYIKMQIIIVAVIVISLLIWAVSIYNRLVSLRNGFRNAYAQIDVQLERRHDLIPNLVETVRGYLAHEHQTLVEVVNARNTALTTSTRVWCSWARY